MEANYNTGYKPGDWIKGKTRNDEWVHGYIESIESFNPLARVKVLFSDNKNFIGRTIRIDKKDIERQTVLTNYSEGELLNFIDLALSTRDEQWFMELTIKLKRKQNTLSFSKREKNN
ncbi:IDEAL domain-containing protein [Alkalihalobacillus sp. MEB130]|uniref:IDEAL domain-containing protein n=1 Tax=Alkalihalobacillus sp. MEB130 TaxID=2976704 RepID=UPI0028E09884|nr:IDEAL domain-containing protein [Alkalihalobacillus sp. MEB130]MDT8861319.1 IDEAL domain-containing protein [Alkalihalobacillus sp. MEB130]